MSFINKVVIITGAGSGIGEAIAIKFATLSARLTLIDINADSLHKVAEQCEDISKAKVLAVIADVSKNEDVKQAVDNTINKFGKIDVVVNCAGISGNGAGILDPNVLTGFDKVMSVNVRSMFAMIHYAAPALIESKGCVVNISSVMAGIVSKGSIAYNVSKAAVAYFTKNVAYDLADKGVRVNSISPGPVATNILLNSGKSQAENDEFWDTCAKLVPLRRNVPTSEIAELATYLASDKAKSITGSDFLIDSGLTLSGMPNNLDPAGKVE